MDYDFATLSDKDFEDLSRAIVGQALGIRFEAFMVGRDNGIDGRHAAANGSIVLQVKHYRRSGFSKLRSKMEAERRSIDQLMPKRYILATSVELSPERKEKLAAIIGPFLHSTGDIFGAGELNDILRAYPQIVRAHQKLWMQSAPVLEEIVSSAVSKELKTEISAAASHLIDTLGGLIGSNFWDLSELQRLRTKEAKKAIALDSQRARDLKVLEARANQEIFLLVHEHKKKVLSAQFNDEEAALDLAKERRDLHLNVRKEGNFRAALHLALQFIEDSPNSGLITAIEETFLVEWIETVEKISNEDLRIIWARLLANQTTEKDDRLSPNAIDLVRRVGPQLVKIFEKLGPVAWLMQGVEASALPYDWLKASQFEELVEVGLFKELEGAKLTFGHFTISFSQRDEAKRRTNFYGLTQAGKQIFRFLSPSGIQIFGEEQRQQETGSMRQRVDFARRFATTRSFFNGDDEALKLIALSVRNLVESRRMSFGVTGRTDAGKVMQLMQYDYQSNSEQLATQTIDVKDLAEAGFAESLLATIRRELGKLAQREQS